MDNEYIIKAENISKSFSTKSGKITPVLNGLSVGIKSGDFAAIMGPSGVGKSTLLYILGSLDLPDSGRIKLCVDSQVYEYKSISGDKLAEIRNKKIGFVFQFHHLLPEFNALENVMMPALIAGKSHNETKKKAMELLELVGVDGRGDHKPMELSGGEQQRIAIARALINDPAVVLADEPTGNLDMKNARVFLDLITDLRKRYNITFLVATHSNEVAEIADHIYIMGDGKIVDEKYR